MEQRRTTSNLTGAERAAVLVMYLDRQLSSRLLKSMSPADLQAVSMAMTTLEPVDRETVADVIADFVTDLAEASMVPYSGEAFVSSVLPGLIDKRQRRVLDAVNRRVNEDFAHFCVGQPAAVLAALVSAEAPQTQAVALSLMGPENAARVLQKLADEEQTEVTMRMARLRRIPGDLADEVIRAIMESCDEQSDQLEVGGLTRTARILGKMKKANNELLFTSLGEVDGELADNLRKRMVIFEDLCILDSRGMQTLLKHVTRDDLLVGLAGAPSRVMDQFLSGVSSRAADDIKEQIEIRGRQPKRDVEAARFRIVEVAMQLAEDRQIYLPVGPVEADEDE